MVISGLEWALIGVYSAQTLTAAVNAMPKPKGEGWYAFWYKFLHTQMNLIDEDIEKKTGIHMPRVVDEVATQTVDTPTSHTETAVITTTTATDPK